MSTTDSYSIIHKLDDNVSQNTDAGIIHNINVVDNSGDNNTTSQVSSRDFDSPYFDEPINEQFYKESTIEKIQKMFPNKKSHMNILFKLYKFIFEEVKKATWEKTEQDVSDDIMSSNFSLDFTQLMEDNSRNIYRQLFRNKMFQKRISAIPVFIDFAYLYYVQYLDSSAPIHKLPMTLFKYKLLMHSLNAMQDDLYACFEQCIENKFIRELRIETPPFYLRTDMTDEQVKEKLELIVKPLCRDILKQVFELHRKLYPADTTSDKPDPKKELEDFKKKINPIILENLGDNADEYLLELMNKSKNNSINSNNSVLHEENNSLTNNNSIKQLESREDNIE